MEILCKGLLQQAYSNFWDSRYSGNISILRMRKTLGNTGLKFCFYYLIFDFVKPKLFEVVYSPKKLGIIICLYHKSLGKLGNAEVLFFFLKDFIYLFLEKGVRERNITLWLPLKHLLLGTWPTTQTCALTGNQTGNLMVHRPTLKALSHTSQGRKDALLTNATINQGPRKKKNSL